jgi:hypothetical protein
MADETYGIQPDDPHGGEGDRGGERRRGQPPGQRDPYGDFQNYPTYRETGRSDGGGGGGGGGGNNAWIGWLVFILIFGVGNLILYSTTGIFFIPIPRR